MPGSCFQQRVAMRVHALLPARRGFSFIYERASSPEPLTCGELSISPPYGTGSAEG